MDLEVSAQTLNFHEKALVIDALSLDYILDEPYLEQVISGGVNGTITTFLMGEDDDFENTLKKIDLDLNKIGKSSKLILATKAKDILDAKEAGKLAVIMGFQGSSMFGKEHWQLNILYKLGLRCLQLTYTAANLYADGCGEKRNAGLSYEGIDFIEAVNDYNIMLDLSHTGHQSTYEAIKAAKNPVCTHSNSYSVIPNDRNKKDETVKALIKKGGVIGACCLPRSVKSQSPTLDDLLKHIDNFVKLVGHESVGLGLDFTSGFQDNKVVLPISRRWRTRRPDIFGSVDDFVEQKYPQGIESITKLPNLTQSLFDRGYSTVQVAAILGGNWFRCIERIMG